VLVDVQLRAESVFNRALLVDDIGDPGAENAEQGGLGLIEIVDLELGIAEQHKREAAVARKLEVRRGRVGADPNDLRPNFFEVLVLVAEGTGLLGATRGLIFGIEIEHRVALGEEIIKSDGFPFLVGEGEVGGFGTNIEHTDGLLGGEPTRWQ